MVLYGIVVILVCMASRREKKSKLVRWIGDLAQYKTCFKFFILFGVSLLICALILFCNSFHIDNDSARYLLSALVQSQAAIVAIVVTLTLVAIQLVVSSYSLRAIDFIKKSPLWWFFTCYGMSIFYGLFVLGLIQKDIPPSEFIVLHSISLEFYIYIAYWFGFVTFALLIVYIKEIFNFLESPNIIERLSDRITKEDVVEFIESIEKQKEDQTQPTKDDPLQPIMDVIHSSIMKYDIATTRIGLKVVTDRTIEIIDSDSQKEISTCFCDHLERVSTLTVNKMDEESTGEVIRNLANFGRLTAEREFESAASGAARSLGFVGKIAAEKGIGYLTARVAHSLEVIGETAAEKGLEDATWQVAWSLGDVGEFAAEKGLEDATWQTIHSLKHIGRIAAENGLEHATYHAAHSLGAIGRIAAEKEIEGTVFEAVRFLGVIGEIAAKKGLGDATYHVAWFLGDVGEIVTKREFKGAAFEIEQFLEHIGIMAVDKGLEDATKQAAWSLERIGRVATEKELEDIAEGAARCLARLTVSSKGIVEKAIGNSKSASGERDRDALQKFMNLYEDELKKPHPRNSN
jgi:hypothetical protein